VAQDRNSQCLKYDPGILLGDEQQIFTEALGLHMAVFSIEAHPAVTWAELVTMQKVWPAWMIGELGLC
jgi:hypothetical protein